MPGTTPAYNEQEIFGSVWNVLPEPADVRLQVNGFPGVFGAAIKVMGGSGQAVKIDCTVIADGEAALSAYEAQMFALLGTTYPLSGSIANQAWPLATMIKFAPTSWPFPHGTGDQMLREYTFLFRVSNGPSPPPLTP